MKIRIKVPTQLAESLEEKAKKAVEEAQNAVAEAKKEKQLKQLEELKAKVEDKINQLKGKKGKKQKVEESLEEAPEKKMDESQLNESEILNQLQQFLQTTIGSGDDAASVGSVLAGLAGIGVSTAVINQLHKWWEKKHPESFKKAQDVSRHMDKVVGGNKPGQGTGVKGGEFGL
jgi:DNA repair exonuclease SbcCD ATPase subunit